MQDGVYVGRLLSGNYVGLAIARLPPASPWGTQFPKINPPKTKIFATLFFVRWCANSLAICLARQARRMAFRRKQGSNVQISHHRSGSGKDRRSWAILVEPWQHPDLAGCYATDTHVLTHSPATLPTTSQCHVVVCTASYRRHTTSAPMHTPTAIKDRVDKLKAQLMSAAGDEVDSHTFRTVLFR
jgi:hypothetical protein